MLSRTDLISECRRLISETLLVAFLPADALPIHPDHGDTAVAYAWRLLREVELDGPIHPRALQRAIRATAAAIRSVRVLDLWSSTLPDRAADRWWPVLCAGALHRRDRLSRWEDGNHTGDELRARGYLCTRGLIEVGLDRFEVDPSADESCTGYGDDLAEVAIDGAPEVLALWAEAFQSNRLILNLNLRSAVNFGRSQPFGQGLSQEDVCSVVSAGGAA
jgi:hypothetical protein